MRKYSFLWFALDFKKHLLIVSLIGMIAFEKVTKARIGKFL